MAMDFRGDDPGLCISRRIGRQEKGVQLMVTVRTKYGTLEGEQQYGYSVFRGIPYAAPPVGRLRFAPAQPPLSWTGIRDAKQFGAPALQLFTSNHVTQPDLLRISREDCLFANVSTPAPLIQDDSGMHPDSSAHLPVYVFIHGGAFETGGGNMPLYSGDSFVRKGIVYVNINYRMGVLGCLDLEALRAESNASGGFSLTDIMQALEWVHENIEQFGGDPECVTLGGESAGSDFVSRMLQTDHAGRTFQRAIMESGSARGYATKSRAGMGGDEVMLFQGRQYAALFGAEDSAEGLEQLRQLPGEEIIRRWYFTKEGVRTYWVSDPVSAGLIVPEDLLADVRHQKVGNVDLLHGYNSNEGSMFAGLLAGYKKYENWVRTTFPQHAEEIMQKYPADDSTAPEVLSDLISLVCFRTPILSYADQLASAGNKVYVYHFDLLTEKMKEEGLGVRHIAEMNFVFDKMLDLVGGENEQGRSVARLMNSAWAGFIKYGDPNAGFEEAGIRLPDGEWKPYQASDRQLLRIGAESHNETLERIEELEYFDRLLSEEYKS